LDGHISKGIWALPTGFADLAGSFLLPNQSHKTVQFMFASIKNLFVQAMIAIGIISSPQVIPPQEVISPEPQVVVQDQSVQNTQEIKKESPVINKQKVSDEKKTENVSNIKTEIVTENKKPEIIIRQVSGQFGNSNNKNITQIPTSNLCTQGEASSVTDEDGSYKWKCLGTSGGKDANCGANKKQDGLCGSLANTIMPTNYDKEKLCSVGISSGISYISNQASWSCSGEYGGEITKCLGFKEIKESDLIIKFPQINGTCGSSNNQTYSQTPTSNLCSSGTSTTPGLNLTNTGYIWQCVGSNNGSSVNCSANYKKVETTNTNNYTGACKTVGKIINCY